MADTFKPGDRVRHRTETTRRGEVFWRHTQPSSGEQYVVLWDGDVTHTYVSVEELELEPREQKGQSG